MRGQGGAEALVRNASRQFLAMLISVCGNSRHILPTLASKCRCRIKFLSCEPELGVAKRAHSAALTHF